MLPCFLVKPAWMQTQRTSWKTAALMKVGCPMATEQDVERAVMLDELLRELQHKLQRRLEHLATSNAVDSVEVKVTIDALGAAITAKVSERNSLGQMHILHLKFRKAVAAEFKPFTDAGGRMPNLSVVITR